MLEWEIEYNKIWCGDNGKISDTWGKEPDITLSDCQHRCFKEESCRFMFHGIDVWKDFRANRCAVFRACDDRTEYSPNDPTVYRPPFIGKAVILTSNIDNLDSFLVYWHK